MVFFTYVDATLGVTYASSAVMLNICPVILTTDPTQRRIQADAGLSVGVISYPCGVNCCSMTEQAAQLFIDLFVSCCAVCVLSLEDEPPRQQRCCDTDVRLETTKVLDCS